MLWWIDSQLMMMMLEWVMMWSTYDLVLVRSTVGWDCCSLFLLLALLVNSDGIMRDDSIAN
jgi:LytS/YehU family sensor histidine kinase